jgi:hypothetical protein
MWEAISSILGAGAIGLGFLLAYLTYRLLRAPPQPNGPRNNAPIYAFEVFCFALVIVGAFLQWASNTDNVATLRDQNKELEGELRIAKDNLSVVQSSLQSLKDQCGHH